MATTASNLTLGPADLYTGLFGADETGLGGAGLNSTPAASAWTDMGGTMNSVTLKVSQKFAELTTDQVVDKIGRRVTERDFTIDTELAEPTLANLSASMNNSAPVTGAGSTHELEMDIVNSGTQLTYKALIVDGWAPSATRRRVLVRKVLSVSDVEFAYEKDKQTVFKVSFGAHYVSPTIKPFKVYDNI